MINQALALLVFLADAVAFVSAQAENPVRWSMELKKPAPLIPGSRVDVALTATIDPGWHLYSTTQPPGGPIATRVTLPPHPFFSLDAPADGPTPRQAFDPNFSIETEFYDADVVFTVPVAVSRSASAGEHTLEVHVYFQTCDERLCLPPRTERLKLVVRVAGGTRGANVPAAATAASAPSSTPLPTAAAPAAAAPPATSGPPPVTADRPGAAAGSSTPAAPGVIAFDHAQPSTLKAYLLLAMTVGALSLLTPCVFPMVPITVSYFAGRASGRRRQAVIQALVYCGGIILTFTALGMTLALVFGASGLNQFAANPWINLLIAAVFLGFAASLFGRFEMAVPSALVTRLDAISRRGSGYGTLSTLLMGLTFTLTSFTCTAPFVGTLLVTASQGDWQWPLLGMLAFSSVFALPFFVLALMPQLLAQLPRSGQWMTTVKVAMGFLEVAAAVKFLSNVDLVWRWSLLSRNVVLVIWILLGIGLAVYLVRAGRSAVGRGVASGWGSRAWAAGVLMVTIFLASGLFGRRLGELEAFLPPATVEGAGRAAGIIDGELPWIVNDYDAALRQAGTDGKLLLIDFTGYTCTNCRWMEANMFPRADVIRELQRYVRVRLYTDGEGEVYEKHQQFQAGLFKTVALPYYAVMAADGTPLATFAGLTRKPAEFIEFLRAAQRN